MVLTCISLKPGMLNVCLFSIRISTSMKCLFISFAHFLVGLFFVQLRFECSLYILDLSPHLGVEVQDPQVSQ